MAIYSVKANPVDELVSMLQSHSLIHSFIQLVDWLVICLWKVSRYEVHAAESSAAFQYLFRIVLKTARPQSVVGYPADKQMSHGEQGMKAFQAFHSPPSVIFSFASLCPTTSSPKCLSLARLRLHDYHYQPPREQDFWMRGREYRAVRWGSGEGNRSSQISEQTSFSESVHLVISDLSCLSAMNRMLVPSQIIFRYH
jgi:hypothetical protein